MSRFARAREIFLRLVLFFLLLLTAVMGAAGYWLLCHQKFDPGFRVR